MTSTDAKVRSGTLLIRNVYYIRSAGTLWGIREVNSENESTFEAGFLTEVNLQNLRVLITYFCRNLKLIQGIESKHCKSSDIFPSMRIVFAE